MTLYLNVFTALHNEPFYFELQKLLKFSNKHYEVKKKGLSLEVKHIIKYKWNAHLFNVFKFLLYIKRTFWDIYSSVMIA